jgi:hypothetical protein
MKEVGVFIDFAQPFEVAHARWRTGACATALLAPPTIGGQAVRRSAGSRVAQRKKIIVRGRAWAAWRLPKQLLAVAANGRFFRLAFAHRGANFFL